MSLTLPFFQVDAFTAERFRGNPAAILATPDPLTDAQMLAIAAENNLSETAFIRRRPGTAVEYDIRWFTPVMEMDLCGHATLASAAVVLERLEPKADRVVFHGQRGPLTVDKITLPTGAPGYQLDFPRDPLQPVDNPALMAAITAAIGIEPLGLLGMGRAVALLPDAASVDALTPDLARVAGLEPSWLAVTAPGDGAHGDVDFVSRLFAPREGIPEDPVTGSLHCMLMPYWSGRLGRTKLRARQLSARRGDLWLEDTGTRTLIAGSAVFVIEGRISI